MAQFYARSSWKKFAGKNEWKGGKPGTGLIHTTCGGEIHEREQTRSIWDNDEASVGPCSGSGETVVVAELWCTECESVPNTGFGAPISPGEYFDPMRESA